MFARGHIGTKNDSSAACLPIKKAKATEESNVRSIFYPATTVETGSGVSYAGLETGVSMRCDAAQLFLDSLRHVERVDKLAYRLGIDYRVGAGE